MGKLIDADEFVEWLMSDAITDEQRKFAEQVKYAADRMKPAQPGWIPCKTALPKEDGQYIVTVKYEHVDGYEDIYSEHGEWVDGHWDAGYGHCGSMEKVLAWQPLPKPWEEEKAEGAATP